MNKFLTIYKVNLTIFKINFTIYSNKFREQLNFDRYKLVIYVWLVATTKINNRFKTSRYPVDFCCEPFSHLDPPTWKISDQKYQKLFLHMLYINLSYFSFYHILWHLIKTVSWIYNSLAFPPPYFLREIHSS